MTPEPVVRRLVGVYDADGSLRGEMAYVWGRITGSAHCGLCDITHGPLHRKRSWDRFVAGLPVPFLLLHRDEVNRAVGIPDAGPLPVVLAEVDSPDGAGRTWTRVFEPAELDAMHGDVAAFADAVRDRLSADLDQPAPGQRRGVR